MKKNIFWALITFVVVQPLALFAAARLGDAAYITADARRNLREFGKSALTNANRLALRLDGKSFGPVGVTRLGEGLARFAELKSIDLNLAETGLKIEELEAVLAALAALPQLETLILDISKND